MITVINKANKGLYNQLFEDVQEWLYTHDAAGRLLEDDEVMGENALLGKTMGEDPVTGEPIEVAETINSLEELFQYMSFITNDKDACIYTRLPLDEEPFFIDADSRQITVPKDFATNGVSVQGDEVAEILFFKVNRFFDATDLNTCEIFIQWKSSETDQYGNFKQGVSRPWIQDITSEPGYLIFGWPISSAITKAAGTVTFSVRFYRLDRGTNQLLYSFSTLDQTVTIKPALDYDLTNLGQETSKIYIEDMTSQIRDRAVDSASSDGSMVAEIPQWETWVVPQLTGWTHTEQVNPLTGDTEVQFQIMNLGIDNEGFSTLPITLRTAALTEDAGLVIYKWSKLRNGNTATSTKEDLITQFWSPVEYEENLDTDAERLTNKTYYRKEGNKFKSISSLTSLDELRDSGETIYQLVSIAELDETGQYTASARNRVGKVFSQELYATPVFVPAPKAPIIGELAAVGAAGNILREDPVTLDLDVTLTDQFDNNIDGVGGKATYVWRRRALDAETPESLEDDNDSLIIVPSDEDCEGFYSVVVTNNLNKKAQSSTSNEVRVTKPAVKLNVAIADDDDISLDDAQANGISVTITGFEPNRFEGDTYTCQWYRYAAFGHDVEEDKAKARRGEYEWNGDIKVEELNLTEGTLTEQIIASSKTETLIPPIDGVYFCEVKNIYNGTESTIISPFYNVVR